MLISAFKIIKGSKEDVRVHKYTASAADVKAFAGRFGFEFTDGQKRAVNEMFENLRGPSRMNRLLQGDVGSGKTAVALCGIYMAVKSGTKWRTCRRRRCLRNRIMPFSKNISPIIRWGIWRGG